MSKKIEKPTNVKFTSIDSSVKGMKEFIVTFEQNGKQLKDFIFVEEKKGYSNNDYLNVAREEFAKHLQKGIRQVKTTSAPFKAFGLCCGAAALTFAGLFTWKILDQAKTITWDLGNGTLVKEKYKLGELPSYKGKVPEIPDDTEYDENRIKWHHTFDGWQEEIVPAYEDTTYHINYKKEPLYLVIEIFVREHYIESDNSTYAFSPDHLSEEERSNWEIDWGESDESVDKNSFEHTYETPGLKYIKIHSNPMSLQIMNMDGDPERLSFCNNCLHKVYLPYGRTTNERLPDDETKAMFESCDLETIVFPSTFTRIQMISYLGEIVDPCTLGYLDIPNNVTTIDEYAFDGVVIGSLTIPNSVTEIGKGAFYQSDINYIKFPKTITYYPSESLYVDPESVIDFTDYDVPPTLNEEAFPPAWQDEDTNIPGYIAVRSDTYDAFVKAWSNIGTGGRLVTHIFAQE